MPINIGKVRMVDPFEAGTNLVHINYRNNLDSDMENMKIKIFIPQLELFWQTTSFDIEDDNNHGRFIPIEIPNDVPAGDYLVRMTLSNDDARRVKHHWVTII